MLFKTDKKFLMYLMFVVVVVVWFCCSSWLAFLILAYHSNLMLQFYSTELFPLEAILSFIHNFFEKYLGFFWVFWDAQKIIFGFSICSSFGWQLCQNCGWVGSEPYVSSHIAEPPCFFRIVTFLTYLLYIFLFCQNCIVCLFKFE